MLDNIFLSEILSPLIPNIEVTSVDRLCDNNYSKGIGDPHFFIVNTAVFPNDGHWIAIIIDNNECIFFDSLGKNPSYHQPSIVNFIIQHSESVVYNVDRIQSVFF